MNSRLEYACRVASKRPEHGGRFVGVIADAQIQKWESNVDQLHALVRRWTRNPLEVASLSSDAWSEYRLTKSTVYRNIRQDEIRLYDELGLTVYKFPKVKIN